MKELFNNILIPVNLNRRSSARSIEKAMNLARQLHCNLHVIHIEKKVELKPSEYLSGTSEEEKSVSLRRQLNKLHAQFNTNTDSGIRLYTAVCQGEAETVILEYLIKEHIDLIVTGKPTLWQLFSGPLNIKRIARKTGCPVLTTDGKPGLKKLRNIVLPVEEELPVRKLMFTSYLAKKFQSKIHLVALSDGSEGQHTDELPCLFRAYQLLRNHSGVAVECHPVSGNNIADTTLHFARRINADLIVVNTDRESLMPGLVNRLISRILFNQPHIPVMTIAST